MGGCAPPNPLDQPRTSASPARESRLTLTKATLEQANAVGQLLWKIQVDTAQYSPDRRSADLAAVKGDFYQDGKVVLKVKADKGKILNDGQQLVLENNVVAVDPRNKSVLRAQEVEWQAEAAVMIARKALRGEHPQLTVTAKEGRYDTKNQRLTLSGQIMAVTEHPDPKKKPVKDPRRLQLKTERLVWNISTYIINGDRPLELVRFQDKTATDQIKTPTVRVDLNQKLVRLMNPTEFKSLDPPLQVAAKILNWSYLTRVVTSDQPLKIVDYENNISVRGNQGSMNLDSQVAQLSSGTEGFSQAQQAKLYADTLTYLFDQQTLAAQGNVIYKQQEGVKFNLTGDQATGSLQNNSVVVTSSQPERVVTEIFPNSQP